MIDLPTISVAHDLDTGDYRLYVTSYGSTMPAGPRLFRAPPHPDIRFSHISEAHAEHDATLLRAYIDTAYGKTVSKKKVRAAGAD